MKKWLKCLSEIWVLESNDSGSILKKWFLLFGGVTLRVAKLKSFKKTKSAYPFTMLLAERHVLWGFCIISWNHWLFRHDDKFIIQAFRARTATSSYAIRRQFKNEAMLQFEAIIFSDYRHSNYLTLASIASSSSEATPILWHFNSC